ncbi:MAG: alpha/beta hydrolase [Sphingobacteriales bacterium]|nr:MAG: alpha/beta hydrolase [Sphingobacteriales bacterium]
MKQIFLLLTFFSWLSSSAQYRQDSLQTEKGYLHYFTKGEGKPVVLLQGGPGYSHHYMRAISDSLKDCKSILIDYQGTGFSNYGNVDSSWVSNEQIVKDIETIREHLKIQKWTLIGHGYGGMFALLYGVQHPQNTEKIITISNAGTNQRFREHFMDNILSKISLENRQRIKDIKSGKIKTTNEIPGIGEVDLLILQGYFYDLRNIPKLISVVPEDAISKAFNPEFGDAYWNNKVNRNFDIQNEVLDMDIPIRMIESWQDPNYDGRQLLLNHQLKNSKIRFINKAGHFEWTEQPKEFFPILNEFLSEK